MVQNFAKRRKSDRTVHFNVGGTLYEVSRSLLDQHPDTMLSRMVSDFWFPKDEGSNEDHNEHDANGSKSDETNNDVGKDSEADESANEATKAEATALFIERDGSRFRYCLDYMRDNGCVSLPPDVPKDALLRDLDYYGFENVDQDKISVQGSLPMFEVCLDYVQAIQSDWKDESVAIDAIGRFLKAEENNSELCKPEVFRRFLEQMQELETSTKASTSTGIGTAFFEYEVLDNHVKRRCLALAKRFITEYTKTGSRNFIVYKDNSEDNEIYNTATLVSSEVDTSFRRRFEAYLQPTGWKLGKSSVSMDNTFVYLCFLHDLPQDDK